MNVKEKNLFDALDKMHAEYCRKGEAEVRIREIEFEIQACRHSEDCGGCERYQNDECTLHENLLAATIPYNNARKGYKAAEYETMVAYSEYKWWKEHTDDTSVGEEKKENGDE
ncbi:MAG: hypothetical protein LUC44_06045 [Prevotellaceae bacterium]|nr:hypothetical protein [Prevotellaceae bacterium]